MLATAPTPTVNAPAPGFALAWAQENLLDPDTLGPIADNPWLSELLDSAWAPGSPRRTHLVGDRYAGQDAALVIFLLVDALAPVHPFGSRESSLSAVVGPRLVSSKHHLSRLAGVLASSSHIMSQVKALYVGPYVLEVHMHDGGVHLFEAVSIRQKTLEGRRFTAAAFHEAEYAWLNVDGDTVFQHIDNSLALMEGRMVAASVDERPAPAISVAAFMNEDNPAFDLCGITRIEARMTPERKAAIEAHRPRQRARTVAA